MYHLIGQKWNSAFTEVDGFPVVSVYVKLASWDNNDCLYEYLKKKYGPIIIHLSIADLGSIIEDMKVCPQTIYGEDYKERAKEDIAKFHIANLWLKANFPFASVTFDYFDVWR